ncbi:MAG: helicase-exonuclease AddAB subunit AddA [Oscillospiraceae bacterium]|nr:helicase-exonuclease AddAB subunit AddA [Oscillospiraceae bacterium]
MENKKTQLTDEQEAAVAYRGGALLVSAAAGSGKTKVLVERLLRRIESGDSINEFLVITFTKAAAAELRERIAEEISKKLASDPRNRHLRRQSMLSRGAQINTIHGFCTDLLREFGCAEGISPDYRIIEQEESTLIRTEILEKTLENEYEHISENSDFRALVEAMAAGRDDRRLIEAALDTYEKLKSHPNPGEWAARQIDTANPAEGQDVSRTPWGSYLLGKARADVDYRLREMRSVRSEMRELPAFEKAYGRSFDATIEGLAALLAAFSDGWDAVKGNINVEFPTARISGYDTLKSVRTRCKAAMAKWAKEFEYASNELIEDIHACAPAVRGLLSLVLEFDRAYSEEKRRRGTLDFSDLEHQTLRLLGAGSAGSGRLSATIAARYKEIMVDEYQDVNAVQETIFNAVSRGGGNIFMVGDVKQSIYRFRLADPTIFLGKYNSYNGYIPERADYPKGAKIFLSRNFRSGGAILDAVNFVFSAVMSADFGEIDYTESERLSPGREDARETGEVELRVIDMSALDSGDDEENPAVTQVEARYIAGRIADLTDGTHMIPDGEGGERPIGYGDIVILLRSPGGKAGKYAAALYELGIPAGLPESEGLYDTPEVNAALSLLSVIDNPMQDIDLAAALSGPAFGFTPDELAGIRAGSRGTDFYTALQKASRTDTKCAAFLEEIEAMRTVMPDMPSDRFIHYVYNRTGLPGKASMRGGEARRRNLLLLAEKARAYEKNGYKGLFAFLAYVRSVREKGAGRDSAGEAPMNTVRIMSVHKSKGLEFPVVFLADMAKRMNYKDLNKPLVIHPALGVGTMRTQRQRGIEYTTLPRQAIRNALLSEMMAEELRVMYVAMTRAREKLIMTATFSNAEKALGKLSDIAARGLEAQALEEVRTMAGWTLLPVLAAQGAGEQGAIDLMVVSETAQKRGCVNAHTGVGAQGKRPAMPEVKAQDVELLRKRFSFSYPHAKAPDLPSKLTVTELKRRSPEDEEWRSGGADWTPAGDAGYSRPDFISSRTGLTGAERGTALHLAMQYIEFEKCATAGGVKGELKRLADDGYLTPEQADAADAGKIARFFESGVGKRALAATDVRREFKFSLLYPAQSIYPGAGEDEIMVQGIVDCFFEEEGELVVLDFKTDRVSAETLEAKTEQYTPQLDIYAQALTRITGKKVRERVIYFFGMDKEIYV